MIGHNFMFNMEETRISIAESDCTYARAVHGHGGGRGGRLIVVVRRQVREICAVACSGSSGAQRHRGGGEQGAPHLCKS